MGEEATLLDIILTTAPREPHVPNEQGYMIQGALRLLYIYVDIS